MNKIVAQYSCNRCNSRVKTIDFSSFGKGIDLSLPFEQIIEIMARKAEAYAEDIVCPKCDENRVYLVSIHEKRPHDAIAKKHSKRAPGARVRELLNDLVDKREKINSRADLDEGQELGRYLKEAEEIRKDLINSIVGNPGQIVYFDDPDEMIEAENALNDLWPDITSGEVFDEIFEGDWVVPILGPYSDRVVTLRPLLVSKLPENNQFHNFFQIALDCWAWGQDVASLIICWSVIEILLLEIIRKKDRNEAEDIKKKKSWMKTLVHKASQLGIVTHDEKDLLLEIIDIRNNAAHEHIIPPKEFALDAIKQTIAIVERNYGRL